MKCAARSATACDDFEGKDFYQNPFALSMSKGTALWLARYFGTDAQSWLNLQLSYDLKIAEAEQKVRIEREVEEMAA